MPSGSAAGCGIRCEPVCEAPLLQLEVQTHELISSARREYSRSPALSRRRSRSPSCTIIVRAVAGSQSICPRMVCNRLKRECGESCMRSDARCAAASARSSAAARICESRSRPVEVEPAHQGESKPVSQEEGRRARQPDGQPRAGHCVHDARGARPAFLIVEMGRGIAHEPFPQPERRRGRRGEHAAHQQLQRDAAPERLPADAQRRPDAREEQGIKEEMLQQPCLPACEDVHHVIAFRLSCMLCA